MQKKYGDFHGIVGSSRSFDFPRVVQRQARRLLQSDSRQRPINVLVPSVRQNSLHSCAAAQEPPICKKKGRFSRNRWFISVFIFLAQFEDGLRACSKAIPGRALEISSGYEHEKEVRGDVRQRRDVRAVDFYL